MKSKFHATMAALVVASMGFPGSATAGDEWFVLGEQAIQSANPSATIKSEGGRWDKDVKQVKVSVEGADVNVTKLVLSWDNRKDDTVDNVGTIKSGGQTAPFNAPGIKGRLTSATIYYTIEGGKPSATVKVLGFD
jgi:hypothetical protein